MSSSKTNHPNWVSCLFKGFLLPFVLPGLFLIPWVPGLATPIGFGTWFIVLGATQRLWLPPLIELVYFGRWTRLFLFPVSLGSREFAANFMQAIAWLWGFVGILFLLFAAAESIK